MAQQFVLASGSAPVDVARAETIADDLRRAWPGFDVVVRVIEGADAVERLRVAVRDGRASAAVQSGRSLPPAHAEGLVIGAIAMRSDPRDALVTRSGRVLAYVPEGARVGTQDARQASQLRRRRTDLDVVEVGDDAVDALARLEQPDVEGVVIRACDLAWLGQLDRVAEYFDTDQMIPAPGQAVPILEVRDGDAASMGVLAPLHDASTAYAWRAERACADRLGAHHASPVGVFAVTDGEDMFVHGIVATPDGSRAARLRWSGPNREAAEVGDTLAELLESIGAAEILAGGPLPPSIRYAERRRRLVEDLDRDLDRGADLGPRLDIDLDQDLDDDRVRRN